MRKPTVWGLFFFFFQRPSSGSSEGDLFMGEEEGNLDGLYGVLSNAV